MVHVKYRNDSRIGDLFWKEGFYSECYIDTLAERPEYPIVEDAREDQESDRHIIFQRYEKRGSIKFYGVESLADAMSILPLMDEVYIDNVRVYDVSVNIVWNEEFECLCEITLTYMIDKIIKTL